MKVTLKQNSEVSSIWIPRNPYNRTYLTEIGTERNSIICHLIENKIQLDRQTILYLRCILFFHRYIFLILFLKYLEFVLHSKTAEKIAFSCVEKSIKKHTQTWLWFDVKSKENLKSYIYFYGVRNLIYHSTDIFWQAQWNLKEKSISMKKGWNNSTARISLVACSIKV